MRCCSDPCVFCWCWLVRWVGFVPTQPLLKWQAGWAGSKLAGRILVRHRHCLLGSDMVGTDICMLAHCDPALRAAAAAAGSRAKLLPAPVDPALPAAASAARLHPLPACFPLPPLLHPPTSVPDSTLPNPPASTLQRPPCGGVPRALPPDAVRGRQPNPLWLVLPIHRQGAGLLEPRRHLVGRSGAARRHQGERLVGLRLTCCCGRAAAAGCCCRCSCCCRCCGLPPLLLLVLGISNVSRCLFLPCDCHVTFLLPICQPCHGFANPLRTCLTQPPHCQVEYKYVILEEQDWTQQVNELSEGKVEYTYRIEPDSRWAYVTLNLLTEWAVAAGQGGVHVPHRARLQVGVQSN